MYHFVLNREQVRRILTGLAIRADDDALELVYGLRVIHCKMERILRQVVGVMHHMSGIVTLEHQHQLKVITEVILTQPQSRRQFLLVDTAGYTSDETYLRLVIQPNAVQRFDKRERRIALRHEEPSVVLERMSGFRYLQTARHRFRYRQFERTVYAGEIGFSVAADRIAVQQEIRVGYRYRTHVIEHASREADTTGIDEVHAARDTVLAVQRHGCYARRGVVIAEYAVLRGRRYRIDRSGSHIIRQAVKDERTAGARDHAARDAVAAQADRHARHARVVGLRDYTAYLAELGTPSYRRSIVVGSPAVALIARYDGILIVLTRHGGLVKPCNLCASINRIRRTAAALRDTKQYKLIHRRRGSRPTQLHAAFVLSVRQSLRSGKGSDRRCLIEIERRSVDGYRRRGIRVLEAQLGIRRVYLRRVGIVRTSHVCYIRDVRRPAAVFIAADAVLRNDELYLASRLYRCAPQHHLRAAVPCTAAIGRRAVLLRQFLEHHLFHRILHLVPAIGYDGRYHFRSLVGGKFRMALIYPSATVTISAIKDERI